MDNTYNIDFIARCIAGHNKTDIKSIKNNISSILQTIGDINAVLEEVL